MIKHLGDIVNTNGWSRKFEEHVLNHQSIARSDVGIVEAYISIRHVTKSDCVLLILLTQGIKKSKSFGGDSPRDGTT